MKIKLGILLIIFIFLMMSCNNAQEEISPLTEEDTLPSYGKLVTENEQLLAENERLKKLLYDNGISNRAERHPLDVEYDNAFSAPGVLDSLPQMRDITYTYSDMWMDKIEKHLALLTDKLDDDKVKWVVESQTKWRESTKANDELELQAYIQVFGHGSIKKDLMAYSHYEQYRSRALFLMGLYEAIKDTVKNEPPLV